jgi:MFS family permease
MAVCGGLLAMPAGIASWWSGWPSPMAADAVRALLLALAAVLLGSAANLTHICAQRTVGRLATATGGDGAARSTELKRMFSWLGLAPTLSNVVGPLLAGVCIDSLGYAPAFGFVALMPLLTRCFMRWLPPDPPPHPAVAHAAARPGVIGSARELLALPGMRRLLLTNWFFSAAWDLFSFLVPLHGHGLGLSATAIGTVLGTFAFTASGVRVLVPWLVGRRPEAQVITFCYVVLAGMFVLYAHTTAAWHMMALAVPLGMALGAVQPMVMTMLHHITPEHRQGEAIALRSTLINLSSAVLPLGYGALGATLGAAALFRLMALVLLVGSRVSAGLPMARH